MQNNTEYLKKLFSEILCCLSTDEHIIEDCVLLRCGGHACKKCAAAERTEPYVQCLKCSGKHQLNAEFEKTTYSIRPTIDLLIMSNYAEIFENLTHRFNSKKSSINVSTLEPVDDIVTEIQNHVNRLKKRIDELFEEISNKFQSDFNKGSIMEQELKAICDQIVNYNDQNKNLDSVYEYQRQISKFEEKLNQAKSNCTKMYFTPNMEILNKMDLSIIGKIESSVESSSIPAESAHNSDQETNSEPIGTNEHVNQDQFTSVETNNNESERQHETEYLNVQAEFHVDIHTCNSPQPIIADNQSVDSPVEPNEPQTDATTSIEPLGMIHEHVSENQNSREVLKHIENRTEKNTPIGLGKTFAPNDSKISKSIVTEKRKMTVTKKTSKIIKRKVQLLEPEKSQPPANIPLNSIVNLAVTPQKDAPINTSPKPSPETSTRSLKNYYDLYEDDMPNGPNGAQRSLSTTSSSSSAVQVNTNGGRDKEYELGDYKRVDVLCECLDRSVCNHDYGRICNGPSTYAVYISDHMHKQIVKFDLVDNTVLPNDYENRLDQPWALAFDKKNNQLYIGDFSRQKVFVYCALTLLELDQIGDEKMRKIDAIEVNDKMLYVSDTVGNRISVWINKRFTRNVAIDQPAVMKVKDTNLYVISACEAEFKRKKVNQGKELPVLKAISFGSNCVFVFNRFTWDLQRKICFDDWFNPRGLYIDKYSNVITVACVKDANNVLNEKEYLFVIDPNGILKQRLQLNFDNIMDFCYTKNTLVFVRGEEKKPSVSWVGFKKKAVSVADYNAANEAMLMKKSKEKADRMEKVPVKRPIKLKNPINPAPSKIKIDFRPKTSSHVSRKQKPSKISPSKEQIRSKSVCESIREVVDDEDFVTTNTTDNIGIIDSSNRQKMESNRNQSDIEYICSVQTNKFQSINEVVNRENIYNMHCGATGRICLSQNKQTAFISDIANNRIVSLNLTYSQNKKILGLIKLDHKLKDSRPWAIAFDERNNHLYIGDYACKKISVFTVNHDAMIKVKEIDDSVHLNQIDAIDIDSEENLLYVCDTMNDDVSVWSTTTSSFVASKSIQSPSVTRAKEKCLYVVSTMESDFGNKMKRQTSSSITNAEQSDCIFVYNRYTWDVLKTIRLMDWSNPRGLYIDDNYNIITVASLAKIEHGLKKNVEHLFIINTNGYQKQRLRLQFDKVYDFCISNRNIVFARGDENPPIVIMDFV